MESLKGNQIPQFINEYQKVEIFSVFEDDTCNANNGFSSKDTSHML